MKFRIYLPDNGIITSLANFLVRFLPGFRYLPRFIQKCIAILMIVLTLTVGTGLVYLFGPWTKKAEAVWFDDNFAYRQRVPVTTHAASETNVYITLTVDTAALTTDKLQADCDDLRFTKLNGQILPYQIVSGCDGATTSIRVGFDTMPIAPFDFYMYYGNPTASIGSVTLTHSACSSTCTAAAFGSEEKGVGPTAYWKFDDGTGTNAEDATTNALDGTLNNTPTWQTEDQCVAGKCLWFDGTNNENVSIADDVKLDFGATGNFTVSGWVKRDGASSAINYIITKHDITDDTEDGGYKLWMDADGDLCFGIDDDITWGPDISACSTNANFDDDKWHHVVGVRDQTSTDKIYVYVDGVDKSAGGTSDTTTDTLANSNIFYVGVDRDGTSNEWLGFIDEPKVYSYARSGAQIQADFNARSNNEGTSGVLGSALQNQPAALSNGLVGYWKLEESATPSIDSSGNGRSGTWNGNVAQTTGKFGYGATLDGTGDYIEVSGLMGSPTAVTIAGWAKTTASSNDEIISIGSYVRIILDYNNNSFKPSAFYYKAGAAWNATNSTASAVTSTGWHHFVYIVDPANAIQLFYIDNVLVGSSSYTDAIVYSGQGTNTRIGADAASSAFDVSGQIDEARIYNRALSGDDVATLYNFAPGPVGYWRFEEGSGTTVADTSGTANTGTWSGSATHWVNGKFGGGGNFTTSNFVNSGSAASLDDLPAITISGWVYPKSFPSNETFLNKATNDTASDGWSVRIADFGIQGIYFGVNHQSADVQAGLQGGIGLTQNAWNYVTITWDGSTTASNVLFYVNGVKGATTVITNGSGARRTDAASNFLIGSAPSLTYQEFDGLMDEVKVYNYVRSPKQIIEDMNANHPAPGSPVGSAVSNWKFDEGYSTTANDSHPTNDNDLTLSSSSWTNSGKFLKAWNGTGALWLSRADDADLDFVAADDFTVSMWFKSDSASNPGATEWLLNKSLSGGTQEAGYAIYANTDGTICFGIDDDTTWTPDVASCTTADFYDATWHHIVAVRNTALDKTFIYVDALEKDSDTDSTTATLANGRIIYLGDRQGADGGDEFNGDLDEAKIYRSALTSSQVALDMNRGSTQVLGALSDNSTYQPQAANQEYCIPGDTTSCDSPLFEWNFEEKTGTTANSTGTTAQSLTLTNGPLWDKGTVGTAVRLDGNDDYLVSGSSPGLPTGDFTYQAWVSHGSSVAQKLIFHAENAGAGDDDELSIFIETNDTINVLLNGGTIDVTAATTFGDNTTVHLVVTRASGTIKIYINGVQDANTGSDASTLSFDTCALLIGADATTDCIGTLSTKLDGIVDQVRIYNYARTAAQIAWDYNKGKPVGWWKFDECQGTTLNDSSGNSLTGTLTGATAGTCATSGAWFNGVSGKRNYSLDFDGTDDVVTVTNASAIDFDTGLAQGMTFAAWIYAGSDGENFVGEIIAKVNRMYMRVDSEAGGLDFQADIDLATTDPTVNVADAFAINTWNHVVISYNDDADDDMDVYINGILRSTGNGSGAPGTTDTNDLLIGGPSTANFDGQIDDVRVYNYGITAAQVKTLYSDGAVRYGPATGAP